MLDSPLSGTMDETERLLWVEVLLICGETHLDNKILGKLGFAVLGRCGKYMILIIQFYVFQN